MSKQISCKTEVPNVLMPPKDKSKMARLIVEKDIINCFGNEVVNTFLLNTGAQALAASISSKRRNRSFL